MAEWRGGSRPHLGRDEKAGLEGAVNVRCANCGLDNAVPDKSVGVQYRCYNCGAFLPVAPQPTGETSAAVGLIGGAALGAAIGGPPGALIGAILGAIVGGQAKGVG